MKRSKILRTMKICHITTVHPAQDPRIFHRMCRVLASHNNDVVLIAPETFTAEPRLRPSSYNERLGRAGRLRRSGPLALEAALREDAEVYHFHDPELIPMALLLKARRRDRAVVYDVHEDYPSMMRDKYWLPRWTRPAAALGARVANRIAAKVLDGIVTADGGVAEDFKKAGSENVFVHYNFPTADLFGNVNLVPVSPTCDLVYIGGLSERAGIFVLFDALKILAQRGVRPTVRLAGYTDGEQGLAAIDATLRTYGLQDQVKFDGRIAHVEVPAWLQRGRIGLVLLQAVPKFMKNIPTKMFEYWACGLPVLASDLPPARKFLVDGENGYGFSPASASELAERIAHLLSHPEECQRLGRNGRRMIDSRWNNDRQIGGLVKFYENLVEQSSRGMERAAARRIPREESPAKELLGDSPER
jgi:glycosyltransferase involved in cell wall biosynthesis